MQHKSHKIIRTSSKGVVRDRVVTRSHSQTDVPSQGAGPSHASGSNMVPAGVPPGYPTSELHPKHGHPHFPPTAPPSFLQYGQPAASSSSTTFSTSAQGSAYAAVYSRAQKAAQAMLSPTARQQLAEDERKRKKAVKAQNKRNRDVDDRVALNSVLPEDRRATSNPPGLVEVIRLAIEYIPALRGALQEALEQIADLENALELANETNGAVHVILSTRDDGDLNIRGDGRNKTDLLARLRGEIIRLRDIVATQGQAAS
ncbi:hypothetical protein EVG20_g6474 [Dentipellis fragilis]|uniref:Uncharacterized protein n=1 Tax=Dentipellis fragilis TaxID=205917 RepID=A0A4Y9YKW7_9AGAM|nr:hypothetical protein EVG20_g6474 [Dentipellis fragilis]